MKLPIKRSKPKTTHYHVSHLQGHHNSVEIEALADDGRGLARIEGKVVFISQALPGELVDVKIMIDKPSHAEATPTKWHRYSEHRKTPFCDYYATCGGCQLQHLSLSSQHKWKQQNFLQQLSKSLNTRKLTIEPLLGTASQHYRRRARLVLVKDPKTKQAKLGFRQAQSQTPVDIEYCPILTPALNQALQKARFELLPLASRQAKEVQLVEAEQGVWITSDVYQKTADVDAPYYLLNQLKLNFDPQGFIQVNAPINQALVNQVVDWLAPNQQDRILDLFCGIGNFSLALAQHAGKVVGVEGLANAVILAKQNALNNQLNNTEFYKADLFEDAHHQAWWSSYDSILLDPGRLGAKNLCQKIGELNANRIVYVSCQSDTLIRDLQAIEQQGYRLKRIQLFDMFPNTSHIESLVLMEKIMLNHKQHT
ncbi:MAG: 23S rRNA (uracil(1939)-C(5))-methyltransferase RlmD [Thiomicrospira sp.]|uniref:23S rRNA (uracil(1939)-C(5))-methyltransferase RlmD n=1 Tax=Thiomicrospira sp. TaxID=935 RepID=UPI0019F6A367|nr:23S rRNA (uracil(1939)-C(5))-methyltransferase RlmD [Thiomicrospira sp.]MBE0492881.1 23S rRNA (uracil(1939)-C(5))-methyltransferase RlmD [Thiomicrospira sp.]